MIESALRTPHNDPTRSVNIPALSISNESERALFELGESRSKAKKALSKQSLLSTPPDDPESDLIHRMWLRQLAYHDPNNPLRTPANVHYMASTKIQNANIMQPQFRNRYVAEDRSRKKLGMHLAPPQC